MNARREIDRTTGEAIEDELEAFDQAEVDVAIAATLREQPYVPEEIFSIFAPEWDKLAQANRELAYAKLRGSLADAFANDTPANVEAFGRAAMHCARLAMDESVRDSLRDEAA